MRASTVFLLFAVLLSTACKHTPAPTLQERKLADTLAKLKITAAFAPMDSTSAYEFINHAYLPHLDSALVKRKLFFRPIKSINYKKLFQRDSAYLVWKYTNESGNEPVVLEPRF